uniref:Uncharacterized protein n=1 Tax=Strigamia maritima TaxID=126957 RepID=T1J5T1_STRMM
MEINRRLLSARHFQRCHNCSSFLHGKVNRHYLFE